MDALISVKDLRKRYGSTAAVDGVSFDIAPGEIVGLIGPNGAGKSTLLKSVMGLIHHEGEVTVLGQSPRRQRSRMLESLSYIADVASLPDWISVRRLLDFMDGVHPNFDRQVALRYLARTEVTESHRVKALSKGMKTQLHLALIMAVETRLLVLDEPTLGLDIIFRTEFYDTLVNEYCTTEKSILVTTHQVEEVEPYLSRVMFIHHGKLLFDRRLDQIPEQFLRLTVDPEREAEAAALGPIYRRSIGDRISLIYEGADRSRLEALGEVGAPGVAELFVAKVKEGGSA